MESEFSLPLVFKRAGFFDIPSFLPLMEEGAYLCVFSSSYIEWFRQLAFFKLLFSAVFRNLFSCKIERAGLHLFVAKAGDSAVAFALLNTEKELKAGELWIGIDTFAVLPTFRRKGIGKVFLKYLIKICPRPALLTCWCSPNAKAMRHLVVKEGFKVKEVARIERGGVIKPYFLELRLACNPSKQNH